MLRDLLKRNKKPDNDISETRAGEAADELQEDSEKIDRKNLLLPLLLFVLCACLGFAFITSMVNSGGKEIQIALRNALTLPSGTQVASATVAQRQQNIVTAQPLLAAEAAVSMSGGVPRTHPTDDTPGAVRKPENKTSISDLSQKERSTTKATRSEERDVFKEFYVKHIETSGDLAEMKKRMEKNMPGMGKLAEISALTPPPVEQLKEIRIFGITCIRDGNCIAITSEGPLKKGDMIGSEIVNNVSNTFFTTNRRFVNW